MTIRWTILITAMFLGVICPRLGSADEETSPTESGEFTDEQIEYFEKKVRPLLSQHCYECHSEKSKALKGELRLDGRQLALQGGESGAAFVAGKPEESLLVEAVRWKTLEMPPKGKLKDTEIATFEKWVEMGAPWPAGEAAVAKAEDKPIDWERERKEHWAFRQIKLTAAPDVEDPDWMRNEIDRFIFAKLKENGLAPSAEAPKHTLIRRVYLDVIGMPPTPAQTAAFVEGKQTWEQVIDQLLNSPQYGVRWGRHWLDVARFSDGYGGFLDGGKFDHAWQYRDWVIKAINEDMAYNRFLELQLVGDILEPQQHAVATGFLALGPQYRGDGGDPLSNAIAKSETLDDRVDTFGRGLMGLTLACARCHDHKFDPIPTLDYYSVAGIFNNTAVAEFPMVPQDVVDDYNAKIKEIQDFQREVNDQFKQASAEVVAAEISKMSRYALAAMEFQKLDPRPAAEKWAREQGLVGELFRQMQGFFSGPKNNTPLPQADQWFASRDKKTADDLQSFLLANPEEKNVKEFIKRVFRADVNRLLDDLPEDRANTLRARREEEKKRNAARPEKYPVAHTLREGGAGNMKVALRGNLLKPGEEAPRRFLRILDDEQPLFKDGSGRLELAKALIAPDNPLPARVFVNRVWGWHFGKGLVRTPSNFGRLGDPPTHPELLDWLSAKFIENGWSLKDLHRQILNSKTWRQDSQFDAGKFAKDGDNRLVWRMNPRKLQAEVLRDSFLAVSGNLDPTIGGKPFDNPDKDFRRTIHARTSRNGDQFASDQFLRLFDFPVPRSTVAQRTPTITPQQSLFLLNNPFVIEQAKALAARLEKEEGQGRVELAYRLLFSRSPHADELEIGKGYLAGEDAAAVSLTRIQRYAQALLCSSEFLFVE
jgi:hypothetical protein